MIKSQIKALIHLIGQENGEQAGLLKDELARIMQEQPQYLREVIEQDFHSSVPAALVSAMQEICWEQLAHNTARFAEKINPDTEEGLTIISRFVNPAISREEITKQLDHLARQLRPILANCNSSEEIWTLMGRFFFHSQGFQVLPTSHDIKDISFGRFLYKKQGSALCLCTLYAVCGTRFGLDAGVADVAGRVLAVLHPRDGAEPIFADPLDGGKLLTLHDCKDYIFSRNLQWNDAFELPLSSRALLRRFLGNMIFVLNKLRDERRLAFLRRYMDILKN